MWPVAAVLDSVALEYVHSCSVFCWTALLRARIVLTFPVLTPSSPSLHRALSGSWSRGGADCGSRLRLCGQEIYTWGRIWVRTLP